MGQGQEVTSGKARSAGMSRDQPRAALRYLEEKGKKDNYLIMKITKLLFLIFIFVICTVLMKKND